jgi:ABC-type glutathione transport system ATPase component
MPAPLVDVSGLTVSCRQGLGWLRVVEDVSFKVERGEVFGLVGESGCGKSTVALQLLGYRQAAKRTDSGSIRFGGEDVLRLERREVEGLRGAKVTLYRKTRRRRSIRAFAPARRSMRCSPPMTSAMRRHGPSARARCSALSARPGGGRQKVSPSVVITVLMN